MSKKNKQAAQEAAAEAAEAEVEVQAQATTTAEDGTPADEAPTAAEETPKKKKGKTATLRAWTCAALFIITGVGLAFATGTGTISSFGINAIATICPLGALESMLGAWAFVPRALISLLIIVLLVLVFGKAFCSWMCPIPHVQNVFRTKKRTSIETKERHEAARYAAENWREGKQPERSKTGLDTRHVILLAVLLATVIFGFPVFCLVCPVGLTFATFILLWRFVQFNEATWGLIVFPAIVLVEVLVLRKWCGTICPLGALISLISKANKTFRPTVKEDACLRDTRDVACETCASVCPEHIDPYADLGERPMSECIKCRSCADACPVSAISFPLKGSGPKRDAVAAATAASQTSADEPAPVEASRSAD